MGSFRDKTRHTVSYEEVGLARGLPYRQFLQMTKYKVLLIIVLTLIVIEIGLLAYFADKVCHIPRYREALQIGRAAGCFEFWANRYQSAWAGFVGAGAALAAAWVAWSAIQKQIKQQERATKISEISYWQQRGDQSAAALANIDRILIHIGALQIEIGEIKNTKNTHIAIIQSLRLKGYFPFPFVNAFSVGDGGQSYNDFCHRIERLYDSARSTGEETLIRIDRNIQSSFSHIPALLLDVEKSREMHEQTVARAKRTLAKLDEITA
ncbi:hypothetical protein SAMN05216304_10893 [Bosea sp. OK403]|uniref:hypothetical protein n=1 Tax=Bosea sp. OK403 TaxID=1855286 RepID=UPI0008ECE408|nr:hypothetical protein [Bosea sp. OK403]SFJ45565.1 hypothetical protein SAMN05216304_10893 [Bosea sp. OK403]